MSQSGPLSLTPIDVDKHSVLTLTGVCVSTEPNNDQDRNSNNMKLTQPKGDSTQGTVCAATGASQLPPKIYTVSKRHGKLEPKKKKKK